MLFVKIINHRFINGSFFGKKYLPYTHILFVRNYAADNKHGTNQTDLTKTSSSENLSQNKIINAKLIKDTKTIPATIKEPSSTLVNLRNLSKKNFLYNIFLTIPLGLIEFKEMSKQQKKGFLIYSGLVWATAFVGLFLVTVVFLVYTWETHEITGREFFNTTFEGHQELYEDLLLKRFAIENEGKFLDSSAQQIQKCDKILAKLIESNKESIGDENIDMQWSTIIIDDDSVLKVFSIKNSKFIILTKKMVNLCKNEDQLAYLLAHQLSHTILRHYREPLSNSKISNMVDNLKLVLYPRLMYIFDPLEMFKKVNVLEKLNNTDEYIRDYFFENYRQTIENMIFSEQLEMETDRIALQLLSRACYDIREIENFIILLEKMIKDNQNDNEKEGGTGNELTYIYKYRFNTKEKLNHLKDNLEKFLKFRLDCGCAILK